MKIQLSIKLELSRTKKEQPTEETEEAPEVVDKGTATTEIRYQPTHIGFVPEEY